MACSNASYARCRVRQVGKFISQGAREVNDAPVAVVVEGGYQDSGHCAGAMPRAAYALVRRRDADMHRRKERLWFLDT